MFIAETAENARARQTSRTRPNGLSTSRRPYFGPPPSIQSGHPADEVYVDPAPGEVRDPQAFMVVQGPHTVLGAHFHFVDQFQLVVEGGGSIGRHAVKPGSAHFAGACTGYGPITAGPEGLSYLTLRASADSSGAHYLPESKARLRDLPRRNVMLDGVDVAALAAAPPPASVERQLLKSQEDGLAAALLRIPAGESAQASLPHDGAGRTVVLLRGAARCREQDWGAWSVLFASADEPPLNFTAGPQGADVLVMQYPRAATST